MIRISALVCILTALSTAHAGDWTSWRGPQQNGVSLETGLPASWSQNGENLVWKTTDVTGRNTPIVMDGRVYIFTRDGKGQTERERLVCMDADDGRILWQRHVNVFHSTIPATRLGWSSPAADPEKGLIYVHFTGGIFACFDRDGNVIWSHSLTEEYGRISGYGGRLMTPVIDGDLVIVSFLNSSWGPHGRGSHRFVAFNKLNGEVVWWAQPGGKPLDTTYSVPVVATINGTRMLIAGVADGSVVALKIGTGEKIWQFRLTKRGINVSPVVHNNRVYIAHSEENLDSTVMGRVVCIDATGSGDVTDTHEVWRVDGLKVGYASPVLHEGRLYVIENKGLMHCLDADTGKEHWKYRIGKIAKGSPVIADGKMYLTEVNARFLILELNDDGCKLLDEEKFSDPDFAAIDMFGSPAISNGRIYLAAMHGVYCIGAKEPALSATLTPLGKPRNAPADAKPATLAVYPAEVLLAAGSRKVFKARVFDDRGRYIKDVEPRWISSVLDIKVSSGGAASTPADSAGAIGFAMAQFEGLKAMARIRVVPNLPFEQDFSNIDAGETVAHWIGGGPPKFVVADLDGEMVLKKIARPDRKFMRSNIYMAAPGQTGYTIQADMAGTSKGRNTPDMGLIANRYRFELMGNLQQARLVTWVAMRRVESKIKYEWQADRWYTLKMRVDLDGAAATVRGKVWPRGESEPSAWTIELVDPLGNTQGSPGLYGYAMADIYYDNVRVWQND